jgi:uncharacterized protein (TIGR02246 family)
MRKHPAWIAAITIAAAVSLGACNKSDDDSPAAQSAKDVQAIKDAESGMVAALKAKDVEKVVGFYASNGVLLVPGQTPTKGSDQLRYVFKAMLGDPNNSLSFQADRVEVSAAADLAYSRGSYNESGVDPATKKAMSETGSYVTVFRKSANGSWKAMEDINTPTAAPVGAVTPAKAAPPPANPDPASAADALKTLEGQWVSAWAAHDVAKTASYYSPDATLMLPGAPVMNGTAAITGGLTETFKDPAFKLEFKADQALVSASGELGYTRGSFTQTSTDPATHKPKTVKGAYVTVFRRQADGSWKAVQDIASPGAPQYGPAPTKVASR